MKLIKLSFIYSFFLMIGSLNLIDAKPYPKLNLEKPFDKKKRRLDSLNTFYLRYNTDISVAFKAAGYFSQAPNTRLYAGREFYFKDYYKKHSNAENFFNQNDPNHEYIIYIFLDVIEENKLGENFINTLFYGCPNVEHAFLPNSYDGEISNFDSIFGNLKNLKTLDISGLKFTGTGPSFSKNPNLEYIDITGATLSDTFKKNVIDYYDNLIICQDSPSLIKSNYIYTCCDSKKCNGKLNPENYMKIKLKSGINQFDYKNYPKDNIRFALSGKKCYSKDQMNSEIDVDNELIIYFLKPLETLESFFEGEKKIESIDLSKLDFSSIVSAKNMFKDSSLKTITLPNNLQELTNMASMFENTPLEQIDLSGLNKILL